MNITVYASHAEEVVKRLDRIAKKAERYGVPFAYTVSEEHPADYAIRKIDYVNQTIYTDRVIKVAAVDIDIECDGLIKADGWRVLAKIEHGDKNGNIVTFFCPACDTDARWYLLPPNCDHCHANRNRSVTFIVEKDGVCKQVGKSCLKEYTGIDPAVAALWAEVRDFNEDEDMYGFEDEFRGSGRTRFYEVEDVIAHACDCIKKYGYRKADTPNCTKEQVLDRLNRFAEPTAEGRAKAQEIVAWLIARGDTADADREKLDALYAEAYGEDMIIRDYDAHKAYTAYRDRWDRVSDIQMNCIPCARSGYAKPNHVGRLAYIVVDYDAFQYKLSVMAQREQERKAAAESSSHVGQVGEVIRVTAVGLRLVSSWETRYGTTYLYKWQDELGNVFVWFASRAQDIHSGVTVKGTVKDHTERDGVKQTVLTRCKWIA